MTSCIKLLLCLIAGAGLAMSQVITGTVLGTVTDPSGASVAGAQVTVINTGTGVSTVSTTNSAGDFSVPYMQPGVYEVSIEAPGFKRFRKSNINVVIDSKARVDAVLEVGNVSESIDVVASAETLQTDASDLNHTVSERALESLPNVGRSAVQFVLNASGIVPAEGFEDPDNIASGDEARRQMSLFSVNGSRMASSEILLDGAPNTSAVFNEIAVLPNVDAIGQLKVITNAYSAEFGRAGGGVVSFGTKSGENRVHGSLFEYFRNPALNANSYGNNQFGRNPDGTPVRPKGKFNTNQFGGTFSGPVWIPNVYNGRNKTFFFASYEGLRRATDASGYLTLPTALERAGDFSQTVVEVRGPNGALTLVPKQIYLPFPSTSTVTEIRPGQFQIVRQQAIDGAIANKIPQRFLNPAAMKLMDYYPLPNIQPVDADGGRNYFHAGSRYTRTDQIVAKIDQNYTASHKGFVRMTIDWTNERPRNFFAETHPSANNQAPSNQFNPSLTLGHTWTVSPSSLVDLRANVTRLNVSVLPSEAGLQEDLGALGFSPAMLAPVQNFAFPRITGLPYPQLGLAGNVLRILNSANYSVTGSYTKILTNWTVKLGGEYRPLLNNFFIANIPSMAFATVGMSGRCAGTGCPTVPWNESQGHSGADFLMGSMTGGLANGQYTTNDPNMAFKNTYLAVFMQNDWKATRRLTINLGLRWDYQGPMTERYNRLAQFDPSKLNITGTPGVYTFSGRQGVGRGQQESDYRNYGPRVGFAWRVDNATVVRSAYGISYDMITGVGAGANGFGAEIYAVPAFVNVRPESGLDIVERPFTDAFNGGGVIEDFDPRNPRFLGRNARAAFRGVYRTPYVQQWNFTVERELSRNMRLSVAYVGTKGTRLTIMQRPINGNNSIPEPILAGAREEYIQTGVNPLTQRVPNPFYGIITGNATLSAPTINRLSLSKAFPAHGNVIAVQDRFGSSSYNSLQVSLRRSFGHGVEMSSNYTWSKNIDHGNSISSANGGNSTFTVNNMKLDRSVSYNDIPHRLVTNFVAELPFGKGRRWFADTAVLKQALGGWKVAGVVTFASGFPIGVTGGGFGRPDRVEDPVLPKEYRVIGDGKTAYPLPDGTTIVVPLRRMLYFNPHAFRNRVISVPVVGQETRQYVEDLYWYGNSPRFISDLRSPGTHNWNMTLSRAFRIAEKLRAEIRCEALNVFNRNHFRGPVTDFGDVNLGRGNQSAGQLGYSTNANFGTIDTASSPLRPPRYLQLSLRLNW